MKFRALLGFFILTAGVLLVSCVSMHDRVMTGQELNEYEIVGKVNTDFLSLQPLHIHLSSSIKEKAHKKLLVEAERQFAGKFDTSLLDIRNIKMQGSDAPSLGLVWKIIFPLVIVSDWQKISASGDVVIKSTDRLKRNVNATTRGLDGAIFRIAERLQNGLPANATISILNITSQSENPDYIIEELEIFLEEQKAPFTIVDRRMLDQIRKEQNLQLSGDISDESAVDIGKMLGASIVIVGTAGITSNQEKRLTIRALDVTTARVVLTARENY